MFLVDMELRKSVTEEPNAVDLAKIRRTDILMAKIFGISQEEYFLQWNKEDAADFSIGDKQCPSCGLGYMLTMKILKYPATN